MFFYSKMIFVVKVSANKEEQGMDLIAERAKKKNLEVYSVARPHGLRGYILLEARDHETAQETSFNLPYVKGIINKQIAYSEIKNLCNRKKLGPKTQRSLLF